MTAKIDEISGIYAVALPPLPAITDETGDTPVVAFECASPVVSYADGVITVDLEAFYASGA